MKKIIAFFTLTLALFAGNPLSLAEDFDVPAEHAIALEVNTGKILYEKDATTTDGIASMTKILTAYLVYKEIDAGKLSWDTTVNISDYAYNLTANTEISNVPMEAREYTVEQLLNAAMVASANSASIALAEHIAGSESAFVDMMTAQLKEWGITDAKLVNASGLNNKYLGDNIYPGSSEKDENTMSALDVATIAYHLVKDYPEVLEITEQSSYNFSGLNVSSYNLMLENMPYYRQGVDGLKTGTTELAGASFVATSTENDMRIISVIMNAKGWEENDAARFQATNALLDHVKNNYELVTILEKGQAYKDSQALVIDGKKKTVSAVAKNDFAVVLPIGYEGDERLTVETDEKGYPAPIAKNQGVGTAVFKDSNVVGIGYIGQSPSMELVAKNEVKRSFFLKVWWNHFVNYVNEKL